MAGRSASSSEVDPRAAPIRGDRRRRILVGSELFTGVAGVIGGMVLIARPEGSLLSARLSALSGTPFEDWRLPGVFLASLVGGGALLSADWIVQRRPHARELSQVFGLGLVTFELVELTWIGFQPLEALFAGIGIAIFALARSLPREAA